MTPPRKEQRPPTTRETLQILGVEFLGTAFVRTLGFTLRFRVSDVEHHQELRQAGQPVIFLLWHARLLPLSYLHRRQDVVALVSEHRDGEYLARVMQRMGFGTARGSSSRGGSRGLRELVHAARAGHDLAITPDGPRGPARELKVGALTVARLTGFPLVPVSAGGTRVWRASSWDRFMVPKPFATIRVKYGPPVKVARSASPEELEDHRVRLERELNRLTDEVDGVKLQPDRTAGGAGWTPGGEPRP